MKKIIIEEVERTYCDVCGIDVFKCGGSAYGWCDKDFCSSTRHNIIGRNVNCLDYFKIQMQIESGDIQF